MCNRTLQQISKSDDCRSSLPTFTMATASSWTVTGNNTVAEKLFRAKESFMLRKAKSCLERGDKHLDLLRVAKLFPEVGDIRFLVEILQLVLEDSGQSQGVRRVAEPFGLKGLNLFRLHSILLLLPHLHVMSEDGWAEGKEQAFWF